jgi:hypothetical protein
LKYAPLIGLIASLAMIACCFFPWAYYPDIQQNFDGFYSMQNQYGKPGKTFVFLSILSCFLFVIPQLWAKRANQVVAILIFAYGLKTYFTFAACYRGTCPEVKPALAGMIFFALIILICSLLSRAVLKENTN